MTDPMTPERLAEIEARTNAATPGPWEAYLMPATRRDAAYCGVSTGDAEARVARFEGGWFDAAFIAAARTDVDDLVAEVRRLQAAAERVRALHLPVEVDPCGTICGECSQWARYRPTVAWPCPTIAALDATDTGDPT